MNNLRLLNKLNFFVLFLFWFKCTCAEYTYPCRMRRSFVPWLIVPPTAPTRHQLIVGFGIPVSLPDHSVTIGFVIKGQYFLPNCIDQLKPDFFWFNDSRKLKRSLPDDSVISNSENFTYYDPVNQVNVERYVVAPIEISRHVEQLNVDSVLDNTINELPKTDSDGATEGDKRLKNSRWSVYKAIEGILSYNQMEGHVCLLKTICELSETKITYETGILGELINVLLTPSSTNDGTNNISLNDYHQAEVNGKSGRSCSKLYPECAASLSDIFSRIHEIMTAR